MNANVGFGPRFVAYLIDVILLGIVGALLSKVTGISVIIGIIYFVYFWSQQNGQTLGNKAMKIRVVREDGKTLDVATGVVRYIGLIISAIPLFLGLFWILWDPKKQGWHDKIAKTIVVRA